MSTLPDRTLEALGAGGALAAQVPGFVPREAQQRLIDLRGGVGLGAGGCGGLEGLGVGHGRGDA